MEKSRRPATDFLQIDPSSTFMSATSSRNFEDLPENFLESISPQQSSSQQPILAQLESSAGSSSGALSSPQLASLAPMSIASEQGGSSYQSIYLASMKDDHHQLSSMRHAASPLEKTNFGSGPAGLLSPLHVDGAGRRGSASGPSGAQYNRGAAVYIKEEDDAEGGLDSPAASTHHHHLLMPQMTSQADLDRNDATPPAVSNVELASTMITTILGDQADSSPSHGYSSSTPTLTRLQNIKQDSDEMGSVGGALNGATPETSSSAYNRYVSQTTPRAASASSSVAKRVYSTKDTNDPLNAEIDDDIYIDTKDLCKRIAYELKQHSIPQAIFAERILCRSQGTLSDLLRNPKPWNKLKSGRETFRRMFNWVQQPLSMRLGILDMCNKNDGEDGSNGKIAGTLSAVLPGLSPPTPAQNVRHASRNRAHGGDGEAPSTKRPRLVFTDIQKRTLQAIFKETQRPSREMQQTIAEHLRLDLSTVANFFMNARRRSRIGPGDTDEPAPYQQLRPITPPPDSPPRPVARPRTSSTRQPASAAHIESSVSSVCEDAIAYSRGRNATAPRLAGGVDDGSGGLDADFKEELNSSPLDVAIKEEDLCEEMIGSGEDPRLSADQEESKREEEEEEEEDDEEEGHANGASSSRHSSTLTPSVALSEA